MFKALDHIDKTIFIWINNHMSNPFFDVLMPFMRYDKNWIPLYLLLLFFAYKQENKKVWLWLLFAILTVVITDQCSSHIIKPFFQRLRPCIDPNFNTHVKLLLKRCSNGFSFTSSHATNHFGIALFFISTLEIFSPKRKWLLIIWASTIAFAQVYVGVHYPFDVICGSILGISLGYLSSKLYLFAKQKIKIA